MLFSDDIDEVLRAAARLNTARQVRKMDRIFPSPGAVPESERQVRDSVEVAEEALELAVRVAAERSRPSDEEWRSVRYAVERRRRW